MQKRKRRVARRAMKKKLAMDMPAIAPLLNVEVWEGEEVACNVTKEDDVAEVRIPLEIVDVVVLIRLAVDGGEAIEPTMMTFGYESVNTAAVAPQYMIYWSSRTLVMVTQAGAADGLDHSCRVNLRLRELRV